ncbi:MAG TPA: hypothetical protein VF766_01820 [Pyrinomonadaceae bacterium]
MPASRTLSPAHRNLSTESLNRTSEIGNRRVENHNLMPGIAGADKGNDV